MADKKTTTSKARKAAEEEKARKAEADSEEGEPLVDGAGDPVIGGVSVPKEKE